MVHNEISKVGLMKHGMKQRIVGVIPARMESTRLPRKPLVSLRGHPLIAWVYGHARKVAELDELLIATDSDEIVEWCRSLRIPAMMTSPAHRSGTDRMLEVVTRQTREGSRGNIYVNIQGDEPFVRPEHFKLLLQPFLAGATANASASANQAGRLARGAAKVSTLKVAIKPEEADDPNVVKVVTDSSDRALYFSRSRIPFTRTDAGETTYYKHLGLYAFSVDVLEEFHHWRHRRLELAEGLEQLRFLENGVPIIVLETRQDTIGVDTRADLAAAEEFILQTALEFPEF